MICDRSNIKPELQGLAIIRRFCLTPGTCNNKAFLFNFRIITVNDINDIKNQTITRAKQMQQSDLSFFLRCTLGTISRKNVENIEIFQLNFKIITEGTQNSLTLPKREEMRSAQLAPVEEKTKSVALKTKKQRNSPPTTY